MENLLLELTIVLGSAVFLGIIFHKLKLPSILGYIFAGILIGSGLIIEKDFLQEEEFFEIFSKIGITLLLFILGLEIKIDELKIVGKIALLTGIGQIVFTSLFGFIFAIIIGFEIIESIYLAIALTFSSTIIIVKLLSDKKEINTLYGRISIGFLLIQDFVAIVALIFLNGLGNDSNQLSSILILFAKATIIFGIIIILSKTLIPIIVNRIADSLELLFGFSLAWTFGITWLISSEYIGLSIEIGGFLAGLALANSFESLQIVSKIRSLRDFFIIIFFVTLGMSLDILNLGDVLIPAIFFSAFVLIGNPLIVLIILTQLKYKARTGILSGFTVAQISEFSLILIVLGKELGHVSNSTVSIITLVGIITFTLSSYAILKGELIALHLNKFIRVFERKITRESDTTISKDYSNHIIIVGADQMGRALIKNLEQHKENLIVVDFNPEKYKELIGLGINVIFGDITEEDILEKIQVNNAKTIISTVPSLEDNLILLSTIKKINPNIEIFVTAAQERFVEPLTEAGATMIIRPLDLAGQMLSRLVQHEELEVRD